MKLSEVLYLSACLYFKEKDLLSKWNSLCKGHFSIVKVLIFIHPDFSSTSCIFGKNGSRTTWEWVWMLLPENMANSRARNNLKSTAALPNSETDFYKKIQDQSFNHCQFQSCLMDITRVWSLRALYHGRLLRYYFDKFIKDKALLLLLDKLR